LPRGLAACFLLVFLFDPFYFSSMLAESLTSYNTLGFLFKLAAFDCLPVTLTVPLPSSDRIGELSSLGFWPAFALDVPLILEI
jgi:hypothetical protein